MMIPGRVIMHERPGEIGIVEDLYAIVGMLHIEVQPCRKPKYLILSIPAKSCYQETSQAMGTLIIEFSTGY